MRSPLGSVSVPPPPPTDLLDGPFFYFLNNPLKFNDPDDKSWNITCIRKLQNEMNVIKLNTEMLIQRVKMCKNELFVIILRQSKFKFSGLFIIFWLWEPPLGRAVCLCVERSEQRSNIVISGILLATSTWNWQHISSPHVTICRIQDTPLHITIVSAHRESAPGNCQPTLTVLRTLIGARFNLRLLWLS